MSNIILDFSEWRSGDKEYLTPYDSHKSFYRKAYEVCYRKDNKKLYILYSYDTRVAAVLTITTAPDTEECIGVFNLWSGFSPTTKRHIDSFLLKHKSNMYSKREWYALPQAYCTSNLLYYCNRVALDEVDNIVKTIYDSKNRLISLVEIDKSFRFCLNYGGELYLLYYTTHDGEYSYKSKTAALKRLDTL